MMNFGFRVVKALGFREKMPAKANIIVTFKASDFY